MPSVWGERHAAARIPIGHGWSGGVGDCRARSAAGAPCRGNVERTNSQLAEAVRLGLKDEGFVDGQNVTMEYRWAAGRDEQLPAMAVELVNRPVAVLLTGGSIWSTISAKAATATIPHRIQHSQRSRQA
jgi:hypothetical protein